MTALPWVLSGVHRVTVAFLTLPGSDGPSAVPDSLLCGEGLGSRAWLEEGTWLSLVRDLLGAWHPPD